MPHQGNGTPFKAGDKARRRPPFHSPNAPVYIVAAVLGDRLWILRDAPNQIPFTTRAEDWEKIVPFFESGKEYTRVAHWSITAQMSNIREWFRCTQIEKNGDGTLVAFGRVKAAGVPDRWIVMNDYDFRERGWEEAK